MTDTATPVRPPPAPTPTTEPKDIPRTYSGLYGYGNDLLPFELARNANTEWVANAGWQLLLTYVSIILIVLLFILAFCPWRLAWTVGHTIHFVVTMVFLHWVKGSPDFYEQGELNAMTFWEQIASTANTGNAQVVMLVVPTLLCYAACHFADYDPQISLFNVVLWCISTLAKLPFMNGVRILGINRTTGIDDDIIKRKSL